MLDPENEFGEKMKAAFTEVCPREMVDYDFGLFDHKRRVEISISVVGGDTYYFQYIKTDGPMETDQALGWARHAATLVNRKMQNG